MPDFALPVTSELSLPWVHGTTVVCLFAFLLFYVACSVSKSLCFRSNGQHSSCRLPNHDYDVAINLMTMSYTSMALGRLDVSFLAAICFFTSFFFFILRLYSVRAAIDSDSRCSYNRSYAVQQTNLQLHIRIAAWTCRSYILCSYSSLLVWLYEVWHQRCRCAVRLRKDYRLTGVSRVWAYANCYTIGRKV